MQNDLSGYSGCRVLLCESGIGDTFVRKISGSIEYNERLKLQAEKQKNFKGTKVKSPPIFNSGYTEKGLLFFDMEYINGVTLAEYVKRVEIGKISNIVETIVTSIFPVQKNQEANPNIFIKKIDSLHNALEPLHNSLIDEALTILSKHDWSNFALSPCHGDLTMENIIVKDNELYFIDFLDSFYDSWLLDIGTMMQDVQVMWSYRKQEPDMNIITKVKVFRDILVDIVKFKIGEQYIEIYYALLLKMVRIYPYIKDEDTLHFCDEKVQMIFGLIKDMS